MELTKRQEEIIEIVKEGEPIIGDEIAERLGLSRATIRPDLSILVMLNILGARPKYGYYFRGDVDTQSINNKLQKMLVKDYMSTSAILDEEKSINDAIVELFASDIGTIFVTSKSKLIGVVSRKDLLRATMTKMDIETTPVSVIMTRMPNVFTVSPRATVKEAAQILYDHDVDAIPVINQHLKVVGRWTKTNALNVFIELSKTKED